MSPIMYERLWEAFLDTLVMVGASGGELGIRGFVAGFDAETGKPSDISKDFVNAKNDATGKPVTAEGKATFGNPVKLTGAQKKAAALAKAAELKDNGNKVQYIIRFNEAADPGNEISALRSAKATVGKQFSKVFKGVVAGLTDKQRAAFAKRGTVASITEDAEVTATEFVPVELSGNAPVHISCGGAGIVQPATPPAGNNGDMMPTVPFEQRTPLGTRDREDAR